MKLKILTLIIALSCTQGFAQEEVLNDNSRCQPFTQINWSELEKLTFWPLSNAINYEIAKRDAVQNYYSNRMREIRLSAFDQKRRTNIQERNLIEVFTKRSAECGDIAERIALEGVMLLDRKIGT